jgi:hypothetical protein
MIDSSNLRQLGEATFAQIQAAFPNLSMDLDRAHPHVDILVSVPQQPGLDFPVGLNLQGDELHLNVGEFWLEWFPCTKPAVREAYVEAVGGLLSGTFRILEFYVGQRAVRAELQRPHEGKWRTIGTSYKGFWIPWRRSTRVLQNSAHASRGSRPN